MKQEFQKGDHVQVAKDLGPSMSHFTGDCEAIVIGSYRDQYGGSDTNSYTLHLKGRGRTSWYYGQQLTLIERDRNDLLATWEHEAAELESRDSNLTWIFNNGALVMKRASGATVAALANHMGIVNLWGSRGEGITLYEMSHLVMQLARPYLWFCDEDGFLEMAHELRDTVRWPYGCGATG